MSESSGSLFQSPLLDTHETAEIRFGGKKGTFKCLSLQQHRKVCAGACVVCCVAVGDEVTRGLQG